MKNLITTRILSLALVLALLLGIMAGSFTAFAEDAPAPGESGGIATPGITQAPVANPVCEIGPQGYVSLGDALTAVSNNGTATIKLLDDISHPSAVVISNNKKITFDLNGCTLDINVPTGNALTVTGSATVNITGNGALNVTSHADFGVYVSGAGSTATVTSATADGDSCIAVAAFNGGKITVRGAVTASGGDSKGAYASGNNSTITVEGDATASGDNCIGAWAITGGTITVEGNAAGNAATSGDEFCVGAFALGNNSTVNVKGNATADGVLSIGASANAGGSKVTVGGSSTATGYECFGAWANGGEIVVNGSITASGENCIGVHTPGGSSGGSTITAGGNVTASGHGSVGVSISMGCETTIDGTIGGDTYIEFWDNGSRDLVTKNRNDYLTPTTKDGYYTYTHTDSDGISGANTVWVKNLPSAQTNPDSKKNSGSSSSGRQSNSTPTRSNTPSNVSSGKATDAAKEAAKSAKALGEGAANVRMKNVGNVPLDALKAMVKTAGMPVKFRADSMSADGLTVEARITLDPAKSTKDLNLTASTTNGNAKAAKTRFEKWYANKAQAISLGQQGGFGQPVEIAAKVDLTGMETKNLCFYSYDKATNAYKLIENPAYRVDNKGYLHFTTEFAGDILVSDGPLVKK